ncbi:MAG: hypothetical protein HY709_12140 [Candidatus Latescibacteria bacterium]|nr:hypothetical protein [Candidatus Latescibacterota bacterium]
MLPKLRIFVLPLVIMLWPILASAQEQMDDVVYLKNGSVIRGVIVEQVPGVSLKIRTRDGNIFMYQMDEIQKIAKEASMVKLPKVKSPGLALGLSLGVGFLTIDGVGQFYNGDTGKGALFLGWSLLSNLMVVAGLEDNKTGLATDERGNIIGESKIDVDDDDGLIAIGLLSRLASYTVAAVDAYKSAQRKNREHGYGTILDKAPPRVVLHVLPIMRNHRRGISILATTSF